MTSRRKARAKTVGEPTSSKNERRLKSQRKRGKKKKEKNG